MRKWVSAALAVFLASGGSAFAGLWDNIYTGLDYLVTPSGSPINVDGNGFRTNGARAGRLRIVPNRLGQGYRLELDRSFGPDSAGRPETFNLGNAELTLSGSIDSTLGFTSRLLPTGSAQSSLNGLGYELRSKTGAQDFTLIGTLNGSQDLEINPLGFYTLSLNVSNANSEVRVNGVVVDNSSRDTDFDIGPINIRGNVYYDIITAALNTFGVNTNGLSQLFPASPIDRVTQNIQDSLASQAKSLESRYAADFVAGVQDEQLARDAQQFVDELLASGDAGSSGQNGQNSPIPEPAALALLALGGLVALRRR
ncbi:MAG: PEP-CTERM sorting domain-containing protein [Planctomycetes bacterium]|nr:PEP-CTERM sorting domain-containing protein [Planctomycetota bacterium]